MTKLKRISTWPCHYGWSCGNPQCQICYPG